MQLAYREYGVYRHGRRSLILLHGLLGSSVNWHGIARQLEQTYHILVPDLRNHGRSPHNEMISYPLMAQDLSRFIDDQGLDDAILIGHSMGGKVAMWLALREPERVEKLVVVDIAPVSYHNRFKTIFSALSSLDLHQLKDRRDADAQLARWLPDAELRQYLLQNLAHVSGGWYWRVNLQALNDEMAQIIGFPDKAVQSYPGETLFIYGGNSDYLKPEYHPKLTQLFPFHKIRAIAGAGHWVYAEQPAAFLQALSTFLK